MVQTLVVFGLPIKRRSRDEIGTRCSAAETVQALVVFGLPIKRRSRDEIGTRRRAAETVQSTESNVASGKRRRAGRNPRKNDHPYLPRSVGARQNTIRIRR